MKNEIISSILVIVLVVVVAVGIGMFLGKIGFGASYSATVTGIILVSVGVGGFGNISSGLKNLKKNIKSTVIFTLGSSLFGWYITDVIFFVANQHYKVLYDYSFVLLFSLLCLFCSIGFLMGRSLQLQE
ncbi:MAG: hypothetical protein WD552_00445 [Candidatus Paceibacterota bacterium]